ncbi:LarC family nickel insertion protein [Methylobacterium sp. WL12]|uniref:LarC family nickel insertion protein n=1 Tax=Methylobacterium sp. WL12 TaxID=2603890 RepID=UPI0011CADB75|nr:LarC family nickel insertion protein [Methylobacterium sp. WL12]TXM67934.1 LarC family nickel insertion protein [Methylobacterium sp. WL12]
MQIHLDAVGGMAGDMFVAALLDAFPQHAEGVSASVRAASRAGVACRVLPHNDGILQGSRFLVSGPGAPDPAPQAAPAATHRHEHGDHDHDHHDHARPDAHGTSHTHDHAGDHDHRPWSEIRASLERADLDAAVRSHALAIFGHLAEAEARVHGISVERVAFHEVGAWDSIADIAAAAHLVAALGATRWSVGALPLGSGMVRTQHGLLPVPAPATALLLEGFATRDDGVPGERVTPTGAAILRHLCGGAEPAPTGPRRLGRSGVGFGTKRLPGLSNCVRALAFDETAPVASPEAHPDHRTIAVIAFEVDDQSGEDLAMGLDRLRMRDDVLDVVQMPVFGKKGRMMAHVRLLARADALDAVAAACFSETATIGLRHALVDGRALPRRAATVAVAGRDVRVKLAERPGGRTAKAEADDARAEGGHAARTALRREAERLALDTPEPKS